MYFRHDAKHLRRTTELGEIISNRSEKRRQAPKVHDLGDFSIKMAPSERYSGQCSEILTGWNRVRIADTPTQMPLGRGRPIIPCFHAGVSKIT